MTSPAARAAAAPNTPGSPTAADLPDDALAHAARLLEELAEVRDKATPEERATIAGTLLTEVRVRDQAIVAATPANPAFLPLIASMTARNDAVGMAPPDGLEPPTRTLGRCRSIH